jgi:hypothetical protein
MKRVLGAILIYMIFMVGMCYAGQDFSVGVYGGEIVQSHSDCDGDHCLDGKYISGVTVDYDIFDSDHFTFRTGVSVYNLTYNQSYRATASDKRENTTKKDTVYALGTIRAGLILFDIVEPYAIIGYGNTTLYGAGLAVTVYEGLSVDAEALSFDDNCDQHEAYVVGLRWSF